MTIMQFGLTPEQVLERRNGIGGSDANILMSGDDAKIMNLFLVKRGETEPDDLSRVLPVQMGSFTEPLNRHWYTLTTGKEVTSAGALIQHREHPFMRCTLDGIVEAEDAVFEAKHVNQFSKPEAVAQKYMAQLHHSMACTGLSRAVLSIFIGTMTHEVFIVEEDPFYTATLIEAEERFWQCVQTGTPPGNMPAPIAPEPPALLRKVDMTGRNEWASLASDWVKHKTAAGHFETATKGLKSLVEFDVGEAIGHGVKVSRAKNGALTIREMNQ